MSPQLCQSRLAKLSSLALTSKPQPAATGIYQLLAPLLVGKRPHGLREPSLPIRA